MTNLGLELLILTVLLIYFGVFMTQSIYRKYEKAIGRPAMMAFMILVGTYVTTGQLIPGVF